MSGNLTMTDPEQRGQMREIAEQAAERAVQRTFAALGVDLREREEVVALADALRWMLTEHKEHDLARGRRNSSVWMVVGVVVGGLLSKFTDRLIEVFR